MYFLPAVSQNAYRPSESYFMSIWHNRLYLYSAAALVFGIWFSLKMALKKVNCLLLTCSYVCILFVFHIVLIFINLCCQLQLVFSWNTACDPILKIFTLKTALHVKLPVIYLLIDLLILHNSAWFQKSFSKEVSSLVYKAVKNDRESAVHVSGVKIFYGSQTGTAKVQNDTVHRKLKHPHWPLILTWGQADAVIIWCEI